jgi:hypothetical protein
MMGHFAYLVVSNREWSIERRVEGQLIQLIALKDPDNAPGMKNLKLGRKGPLGWNPVYYLFDDRESRGRKTSIVEPNR